jgi:hypothetical protein
MTKILAIAGRKQAGKSTLCNFLHGYQLRCFSVIKDFALTEEGDLYVDIGDGKFTELDISRKDVEFIQWANYHMYPFVKKYSFASELKDMCINLFNIPYECVYGTEEQKNTKIKHLKWQNLPDSKRKGVMTAREFMQYLGTDIMRKIYEPVWSESCVKKIQKEQPLLAVIDDLRFANELEQVHKVEGKVVGLTRNILQDSHSSENLDGVLENADSVIDNSNMSINDVNKEIVSILNDLGWLGDEIVTEKKSKLHEIKG